MHITKDNLKEYAEKLMFRLEESEYDTLVNEFDTILEQMKLIDDIEGIENVEPMTFPFSIEDVKFRKDEVSDTIDREDVIKNAKEKIGYEIKVPKVVE